MTQTTYSGGAVELLDVTKVHERGGHQVHALNGVSVAFPRHRFTAVVGPSGSGKSSLLHCAAGLDRPTSGTVRIDGHDLAGLTETELTRLRRDRIGFVFQALNLIPTLTVEQNVLLPAEFGGRRADPAQARALLTRLGLAGRFDDPAGRLSGGQQQRVAIARALLPNPAAVFADEPTGALDVRSAGEVMRILRDSVSQQGQTVVLVTHDPVAASYADEVLVVADGSIVDVLTRPSADEVAMRLAHLRPAGAVR